MSHPLIPGHIKRLGAIADEDALERWSTVSAIDLTSGSPTAVTLLSGLSTAQTIDIHINGFSTNTANQAAMIQIGDSGGFHTSGYVGEAGVVGSGNSSFSTGFLTTFEGAQDAATVGYIDITLKHMGGNVWSFQSTWTSSVASNQHGGGVGNVTLDTALTQVRITTSGGTAVIDGGTGYARHYSFQRNL